MIYLIITSSIDNKHGLVNHEHRKKQYLTSISNTLKVIENECKEHTIKPIIVENNGMRKTYLDDLDADVLYTNHNQTKTKHKGVNELLDIQYVINHYNIQDDDIVIKLTGRYEMLNRSFFDLVMNHQNVYDAFVKFYDVCAQKYKEYDCVLGLFAIKCKYLKEFHYECKTGPECEFAMFVKNQIEKNKIVEVEQLNLECCFADNLRKITV